MGGHCGASGSVVGGEAAVQDMVEAMGREGGVTDHTGVVGRSVRDNAVVQRAVLSGERRRCDGRSGGMQRCVCILFAHGHGRDPLEGGGGSHCYNRIKDRNIFLRKMYFFQYLFFGAHF